MNKNMLCSRCHKNPAVFFISKVDGDKTTNEGLCIKCALELNIGPVKQIMEQMGISEDSFRANGTDDGKYGRRRGLPARRRVAAVVLPRDVSGKSKRKKRRGRYD